MPVILNKHKRESTTNYTNLPLALWQCTPYTMSLLFSVAKEVKMMLPFRSPTLQTMACTALAYIYPVNGFKHSPKLHLTHIHMLASNKLTYQTQRQILFTFFVLIDLFYLLELVTYILHFDHKRYNVDRILACF